MKQKLMVVCGGQSSEHIVSRMSCTSVMNNLNKETNKFIKSYLIIYLSNMSLSNDKFLNHYGLKLCNKSNIHLMLRIIQ